MSQNRWPSLGFDIGAANDLLSPFLPAGFYYKTFLWPASWWTSVYEPFIRRAAGLGRAPTRPDPDRYLHRHAHCDVLVVGAGPAGLMAALAAGRSGARVILVEREAELGGSLLSESGTLAIRWARGRRMARSSRGRTRRIARGHAPAAHHAPSAISTTTTSPCSSASLTTCRCRRSASRASACGGCGAKQVVLATGAIERPLVFHGNDRPGVMLASAARTYLNRYAVRPGAGRSSSPTMTAPMRRLSIWPMPASPSRPLSTCARGPTVRYRQRLRPPACRSAAGPLWSAPMAACASAACGCRRCGPTAAEFRASPRGCVVTAC